MVGIAAQLTSKGLEDAIQKVAHLGAFELAELVDGAGAILESSSKERFESKISPDGVPWAEWSEDYAQTRQGHHSLLVGNNDLLESVQAFAHGKEVHVGSPLVYAAVHQMGGEDLGWDLPARPYLGVSRQDEEDLLDLVTTHVAGIFQ